MRRPSLSLGLRRIDWRRFGRLHARAYRRLGGRGVMHLGSGREGLVLTTIGRKTGKLRSTPLVFMWHRGDIVVFPSNGGLERPPGWLLNLEAHPDRVHVQIGADWFPVTARRADEEERAQILPRAEAYNAHWREYLTYVRRELPFILLTPR